MKNGKKEKFKFIRSDLILSIFTVVIPVIFQLNFIWYVSNYIDEENYGVFVIVNGLILALTQVLTAMPLQIVNRYYNSQKEKSIFINEIRTISYSISIISICLFLIVSLFYVDYFSKKITFLCILYIFVSVNSVIFQQLFFIKLNRLEYLKVKIIDGLAKFIAPIVGYVLYPEFEGILMGITIGQLSIFIYLEKQLIIYPRAIVINRKNIAEYLKFSYPVLFTATASWIIVFSDRLFIERYIGVKEVAWYSILVQAAGFAQILNVLYTIYVTPTVLKVFDSSHEDGIKLLDRYLKNFGIALLIMFVVFIFIPEDLFEIILGVGFFDEEEKKYVFILVMASVFLTIYQTAQSLYFVLFKKLNSYALSFSLCALINFILNFYIEDYGVIAAAGSTLISYILLNILIITWKINVSRKNIDPI